MSVFKAGTCLRVYKDKGDSIQTSPCALTLDSIVNSGTIPLQGDLL